MEIKFRAKRIDNSKKARKEFVYGSYLCVNTYDYDWKGDKQGSKREVHFIVDKDDINILIDKDTLGQYTGLHDGNGQDIYEGDILLNGECDENYIVSFEDGRFIGTYDNVCEDLSELKDCEVVGNIWENKDLLKRIGVEE